jgi:hypothetical protein
MFSRWRRIPRTQDAIAAACFAGALFYFQPVSALPWFASVLPEILRRGWKRDTAALVIVPCVLCLPWCLRNWVEIGVPTMRDNLGIELYVSFNGCAPVTFQESLDRSCIQRYHPNSSLAEAIDLRRLGEKRYNEDRLAAALSWVAAHPGRSTVLIARRFMFFWLPIIGDPVLLWRQHPRYVIDPIITIASVFGLYVVWKEARSSFIVLTVWLTLFPLIYYVVQAAPRYRYPVLWISWLLAGQTLVSLTRRAAGLIRRKRVAGWVPCRQGDEPSPPVFQIGASRE